MASITSLMSSSSSSSSIYGNRTNNMITGLASGMDTEAMIEGMVQGYKQKILQLQKNKTTVQWQQESYQSISDKLVEFSRKYISYSSTSNLMSSAFFNNSVVTTAKGDYANMITATGKSSSEIVINSVTKLAKAAQAYSPITAPGTSVDQGTGAITVSANEKLNFSDKVNISKLEGSLTLTYGAQKVTISFDEQELLGENSDGSGNISADKLKDAIVKKLGETTIGSVAANERIDVKVENGQITFGEAYISGATGKLAETLNLKDQLEADGKVTSLDVAGTAATSQVSKAEYLSDKTISVTVNGTTKTIALKDVVKPNGSFITSADEFKTKLNEQLGKAFGDGTVTADVTQDGKLSFTVQKGSTLSVQSSVDEFMGFDGGMTSYLDTSKSLKALGTLEADGTLKLAGATLTGTDKGVDENGEKIYEYTMTINGETMTFDQNATIDKIMNAINASDAGIQVSYSKLTNQFNLVSDETGKASKIETTADDLGAALFGVQTVTGDDAEFTATINGQTTTYTRSSNTVDLDGLKVTLEGKFSAKDKNGNDTSNIQEIDGTQGVTFNSKTDSSKIVEAIKQMVSDFNTIATEVKKAYSDMPLQQSNGDKYEPLSAEDEADMTENEIKAYEEKAKTGILFMDRDLSSLYSALRDAVVNNSNAAYLRSIGITTSYENGLTTLSVDETKLTEALESDLDGVRNAFTSSKDTGSSSDGVMAALQDVIDRYASTTGATKGILIERAGSKYSPTASLKNTMLSKMQDIEEQISRWQEKMNNQVDYYTSRFTQLEVLINQMNSQSSALAGLTGGY
ncbi:flagellar filament capping protein FliD [Candidatus Avoscillospira sp. LCP25S3_F1]|uniref:flagellar filament capping protein FliD n=1 Tax=Candidatus Avoscillospira sp. LCP25S3_F1 TaxID=3438825 RepID=UPI003F92E9AE